MDIFNKLFTMEQTVESVQPTLFPFPFTFHLVFSIISVVFFLYRFFVQKKPYQLILAIAVPLSMLIWLSEKKALFYIVGAIELVLVLIAFVTSIVCKPKKVAEDSSEGKASDESADDEEE